MRQAKGASRRTLLIIGASAAFLASACSASGGEKSAATSTTVPAATSSTMATTTSTEAAPTSTTEPSPETTPETTAVPTTSTTEPAPGSSEPETLAVAFLRAAVDGGDPSPYVNDPSVAAEATLEWADLADADRSSVTVEMEPTFVDPEAQAGDGGQCQLVGDTTLQCAVLVSPPGSASGEGSPTLYAVYVTNVDPASPLDDPRYVDYFVIDFEPIAG